MGEYIVTARQKGKQWYVGAMTNWLERTIEIPLNFLEEGVSYKAVICKDGINADRYPADYTIIQNTVKKNEVLNIHLAPGGGCMVQLIKQ